jgi:SNF2 family DNA or RNA helicase
MLGMWQKTIQGIASMAVFMDEWPVLGMYREVSEVCAARNVFLTDALTPTVLCPSSARYHWESEFLRWLGVDESRNNPREDEAEGDSRPLRSWQINVLSSAKAVLFPYPDTKIVICTYGLALALVQADKLRPGMFGCAIVDESHMLKNKLSKRSKALVPLLSSIPRCVLLSGTPALARPAELWPQLEVLGVSGRNGFWDNEADFLEKYVKRGGSTEKAELHTMLTGETTTSWFASRSRTCVVDLCMTPFLLILILLVQAQS